MHTALILVWAGTMSLFELGGNLYSHFIISILHLISAGILALGGIYHAIVGAERLEETSFSAPFGSSGWIISINNMEDLIGGHYWVSFYLILGSCWHIQTRALTSI